MNAKIVQTEGKSKACFGYAEVQSFLALFFETKMARTGNRKRLARFC